MPKRAERIVQTEVLRQLMLDLLTACGCPQQLAAKQAEMHLEADLRGIGIQGLDHLFSLIDELRGGHIDPRGEPEIIKDLGPTILIDCHY